MAEVDFLAPKVNTSGIHPFPASTAAVSDFPKPATIKELQQFLGMINYYRRFIPAAAAILKLLTDALAGKPKDLAWSPEMEKAFAAVPLHYLDPSTTSGSS